MHLHCHAVQQSDKIHIPIRVLSEPDPPLIYLPAGGVVSTIEDQDVVLDNMFIVERDGFYDEGEMEGEIGDRDMDDVDARGVKWADFAGGRRWQGKVRYRSGLQSHSLGRVCTRMLMFPSGDELVFARVTSEQLQNGLFEDHSV